MKSGEYEIMFRVEERHWWYRALRRFLVHHLNRFLPGWQDRDILDAGCGTGGNLQHLGGCPNHTGIDLADEAIDYCQQRGLPNVIQGNVTQLPLEDQSQDAVISTSVLYHQWVENVDDALQEFHRVLRPGGWLFIDVPAFKFLHSPHDEAVLTARRFTRGMLREQLSSNGFTIRRMTYWNSFLFPLVWLVRRFGLVRSGRDFGPERSPGGLVNSSLNLLLALEFQLSRLLRLPFGVSLAVVAQKTPPAP
ncbi:MAG: class I SAM-dependent methyltransferase [Pirellulaceae bacterium]